MRPRSAAFHRKGNHRRNGRPTAGCCRGRTAREKLSRPVT
jgi:hypothetical protein